MSKTQPIYPGSTPTISFRFTKNGVLTDPTTLNVIVRDPSGAEINYAYLTAAGLTRTAQGVFQLVFLVPRLQASVGLWRYRCELTGFGFLPVEKSFRCERSPFAMS